MTYFHGYCAVSLLLIALGCQAQQPSTPPAASDDSPPPEQVPAAPADPTGRGFSKANLDRIEAELKIELPKEYREFMLRRSAELSDYKYTLRGETMLWFDSDFFAFDLNRLIAENRDQRSPSMAAGGTFPGWWREYFFIGTNGGGDYYALRLDGKPGVWFLACDAGTVKLYVKSLDDYLARSLEDYDEEMKLNTQLEALYQRKVRGEIGEAEFDKQWDALVLPPQE